MRETVRHIVAETMKEVPAPGETVDMMVCLEYWVSRRPTYVLPPMKAKPKSASDLAFEEEMKRFGSGSKEPDSTPCYFGAHRV
jgi:hypothetical protein